MDMKQVNQAKQETDRLSAITTEQSEKLDRLFELVNVELCGLRSCITLGWYGAAEVHNIYANNLLREISILNSDFHEYTEMLTAAVRLYQIELDRLCTEP